MSPESSDQPRFPSADDAARIFRAEIEALEQERALNAEFETAPGRFFIDPVFHAKVTLLAQVFAKDREFKDLEPDAQRDACLGLAAKAIISLEQMERGGIIALWRP